MRNYAAPVRQTVPLTEVRQRRLCLFRPMPKTPPFGARLMPNELVLRFWWSRNGENGVPDRSLRRFIREFGPTGRADLPAARRRGALLDLGLLPPALTSEKSLAVEFTARERRCCLLDLVGN